MVWNMSLLRELDISQDGGSEQMVQAIEKFITATPSTSIKPFCAYPISEELEIVKKNDAEIAANLRALSHGDIGISNPSDGGVSYVATTQMDLKLINKLRFRF